MADAVGRLDFPAKLRKNTKKRKENGDNLQATARCLRKLCTKGA